MNFDLLLERQRAEAGLRHLEMAETKLKEEATIAYFKRNFGHIERLRAHVARLENFLADLLPPEISP
jgi:hypothetical protein